MWIYGPTGALTTAVTYTTSGWDPRLETDGQLLGNNKTLIFFDNPTSDQLAAWLLGTTGLIEKTFLWADVGGWVVEDSACDEFGNIFRILYDNAAARQLAQFVFDGDGNWTAANTFTY